jgi:RloB-like protein
MAGSLSRALNMAADNEINIVYSSICWEYWYLLHTEYTTRQFETCAQLISYLKTKEGFEDYEKLKGYPKAWEKLLPRLQAGSLNSFRLRTEKQAIGERPHAVNPWINVDELVQFLLEL